MDPRHVPEALVLSICSRVAPRGHRGRTNEAAPVALQLSTVVSVDYAVVRNRTNKPPTIVDPVTVAEEVGLNQAVGESTDQEVPFTEPEEETAVDNPGSLRNRRPTVPRQDYECSDQTDAMVADEELSTESC